MIIGLVSILGLAVVGGLWWGLSKAKSGEHDIFKEESQKPVIVKPTRSERGVRRKVQLWEGGPYWACKNIGAEEPWESGYYFWWGDIVGYKRQGDTWEASNGTKSYFSFEEKNTPTYEMSIAELRNEEWITSDNILARKHDAAHVHWGGDWRMPTDRELQDLNKNCDSTWATMNGVNGYVFRGRGAYATAATAVLFVPSKGPPNSERSERIQFFNSFVL